MVAPTEITDGDHAVELIVCDASASSPHGSAAADNGNLSSSEEIDPLLKQEEKPKINIFSVSYSRTRPREQIAKLPEMEASPLSQFILWIWGGSRYSGILCIALSSTIYFVMEVVSASFSARSIPLFETTFARCTIVLILSYIWLRKSGQPVFGAVHARKLLFLRALMGYISLLSFILCIQRLPLSQAIALNFMTPIMASIAARIMLHEKLKFSDIGGLACSFFGILFIYGQIHGTQGGQVGLDTRGSHRVNMVLLGLFSSITGGISYCLIKAGAKASDQPMVTVFSFGLLSSPAAGICTFAFEEFVLPDLYSFTVMLILGILAFLVEVFLARGLQLEKTSRAVNIQYIEAALSQLWNISLWKVSSYFSGVVGCILILISVCSTIYTGPDKETE